MKYSGNLLKMKSQLDDVVHYHMPVGNDLIGMNEIIGEKLMIKYNGQINCIRCGRKTSKSFHQGYCYPCFMTAPETDTCILKPEMCRAHEGISRDMEWSQDHCLQDHFVYLSYTSDIKVGVTRHTQVPTRWIDQGAQAAIKIARTPNRHLAGEIEVELKKAFRDKTNWRNMLSDRNVVDMSMIMEKEKAWKNLPKSFQEYFEPDNTITRIEYPVEEYPDKVKSMNLDKDSSFEGVLTGIKGQYLMFDRMYVMNVRKYNGYFVELEL